MESWQIVGQKIPDAERERHALSLKKSEKGPLLARCLFKLNDKYTLDESNGRAVDVDVLA